MKRRKFLITTSIITLLLSSVRNLFATSTSRLGFVLKKGKNRFNEHTMLVGNSPIDIKLSGKDTGGVLTVGEYTGYVKGGPPLHIHPAQDEAFYILEGELLFQLGDKQFHLFPGDTIFIPRNTSHAPAQLSEKGRYLYFFTPAGKMEDFFRALSALKQNATSAEAVRIFESHDMRIVGPPLAIK
ncbi:hypothetical protein A0256_14610 [Mucilaginibacter sp. PAMC 26640]|nr:hypothetical protein A0256_14610 [Mucilaginibacter sp. PAMC 26640]